MSVVSLFGGPDGLPDWGARKKRGSPAVSKIDIQSNDSPELTGEQSQLLWLMQERDPYLRRKADDAEMLMKERESHLRRKIDDAVSLFNHGDQPYKLSDVYHAVVNAGLTVTTLYPPESSEGVPKTHLSVPLGNKLTCFVKISNYRFFAVPEVSVNLWVKTDADVENDEWSVCFCEQDEDENMPARIWRRAPGFVLGPDARQNLQKLVSALKQFDTSESQITDVPYQ